MKAISTNIAFVKYNDFGKDLSQNKERIQNGFIQNGVDRESSDFPFVNFVTEFLWLVSLNKKVLEKLQIKSLK